MNANMRVLQPIIMDNDYKKLHQNFTEREHHIAKSRNEGRGFTGNRSSTLFIMFLANFQNEMVF